MKIKKSQITSITARIVALAFMLNVVGAYCPEDGLALAPVRRAERQGSVTDAGGSQARLAGEDEAAAAQLEAGAQRVKLSQSVINPNSGIPEGSMVLVPAELVSEKYNDWAEKDVSTVNRERLEEEIAAGRIVRHKGKYYVWVQNPLYFGFEWNQEGQRSITFGSTTLKGKGLNRPKRLGGFQIVYEKSEQGEEMLGGLPGFDSSSVTAAHLRNLFREHESDYPIVLAKKYGADINMILEPIAEFGLLAFPVAVVGPLSETEETLIRKHKINLPPILAKTLPRDVVLIDADAYFEFLCFSKEAREDCEPVVSYYRSIVNGIRVPRLVLSEENRRPFYQYYGYDMDRLNQEGAVSRHKANEEIVMGAAARFGVFIYLTNHYMNAGDHSPAGSIFCNGRMRDPDHDNTNPLCLFDYDIITAQIGRLWPLTASINDIRTLHASDLWRALSELKDIREAFPVNPDVFNRAIALMFYIAAYPYLFNCSFQHTSSEYKIRIRQFSDPIFLSSLFVLIYNTVQGNAKLQRRARNKINGSSRWSDLDDLCDDIAAQLILKGMVSIDDIIYIESSFLWEGENGLYGLLYNIEKYKTRIRKMLLKKIGTILSGPDIYILSWAELSAEDKKRYPNISKPYTAAVADTGTKLVDHEPLPEPARGADSGL